MFIPAVRSSYQFQVFIPTVTAGYLIQLFIPAVYSSYQFQVFIGGTSGFFAKEPGKIKPAERHMVGDLADLNAVPLLIGCLCFDDVILAKQKEQKKTCLCLEMSFFCSLF